MDIVSRWKNGLSRSSKAHLGRLAAILGATEISKGMWDDLESLLIQADLGIETSESILESLQTKVRELGLTRSTELNEILKSELRNRIISPDELTFDSKPSVILFVGVNGSGKTTTIGKLGHMLASQSRSVLFVGADTFRAAAVDQLQSWADKFDIPLVTGKLGSDPGAVVYDGMKSAIAKKLDVVLIDTAGRLHTRYNLMEELKKIYHVAGKALQGAPNEVWLVLDATIGQNSLSQSRAFKEAVGLTGVILTKLDSSARGGMVFAIQHELGLPILFVGLGEKPEDLVPFDPDAFVKGILAS